MTYRVYRRVEGKWLLYSTRKTFEGAVKDKQLLRKNGVFAVKIEYIGG
jgi:hypothetical protein